MKLLKVEEHKSAKWSDFYISARIRDDEQDITFWVDLGIVDEFGKSKSLEDIKTMRELYECFLEWEWNQYIFHLCFVEDTRAKEYQEDENNMYNVDFFIDDNRDTLMTYFYEEWKRQQKEGRE